jgi:hypothetical protein
MIRFPPWYGTRFDHHEPGANPEQAAERFWAEVDARYERWRDDQILDQAADRATEHDHRHQS